MKINYEIASRFIGSNKPNAQSLIPIIPRDGNIIVKATGKVDVIKMALALNRDKFESLVFETYEVVAIGQQVDYLPIGSRVLIPAGIPLSARVEVPNNDKSLQRVTSAFEGMKSSEIQSYAAKNPKDQTAEVVEYLGAKSYDVVAILDSSYELPKPEVKSSIIL